VPQPEQNFALAGSSVPHSVQWCTAGAKFCMGCGQALAPAVQHCTECGTELPASAHFCSGCGTRVGG